MRSILGAVAAAIIVSPALSAQPGRLVSRRLTLSQSDWGCIAVQAPLVRRTSTERRGSDFWLEMLTELTDSAAAQPLPAVLIRASVLQSAELRDPFGQEPTLTLRLDGGAPQIFRGVEGHALSSRRPPYRAVYSAWFKLLRADLERIGGARTVTGTAEGRSFAFGPEQIATLRDLAAFAAQPRQALVPWSPDEAPLDCRSYMNILDRFGTG